MKKKILTSYAIIMCAVLILSGVLTAAIFNISTTRTVKEDLISLASALLQSYNSSENMEAQAIRQGDVSDDIRATIIAADGTVLADSWTKPSDMGNHADREEILLAKKTQYGISIRDSGTVNSRMMYVATQCPDGNFLRVARFYPTFLSSLLSFSPALLVSAAVCFLIALIFSSRIAASISAPIQELSDSLKQVNSGKQKLKPENYPYEELQSMAGDINRLSDEISANLQRLEVEKAKINYILDNMNEGFLLLDYERNVLICNKSARIFLQCSENILGKAIVHATRNIDFLNALSAVNGNDYTCETDLVFEDNTLEVNISTVADSEKTGISYGIVVLLNDVTEKRNLAKMRSEFFSNASHELKTPITSIGGFVELLSADTLPNEKTVKEYLSYILKETHRITSLINDVILISRLESGDLKQERTLVELSEIIKKCCDNAVPSAVQNDICLTRNLTPCTITASAKEMATLADNLIINAIRYNRPKGRVNVSLQAEKSQVVLRVNNTGDTIEKDQQARIFERFYRIDKGRSASYGGTGLGLSIVKHIALQYGGTVDVESDEENGNTFTITLPLDN